MCGAKVEAWLLSRVSRATVVGDHPHPPRGSIERQIWLVICTGVFGGSRPAWNHSSTHYSGLYRVPPDEQTYDTNAPLGYPMLLFPSYFSSRLILLNSGLNTVLNNLEYPEHYRTSYVTLDMPCQQPIANRASQSPQSRPS